MIQYIYNKRREKDYGTIYINSTLLWDVNVCVCACVSYVGDKKRDVIDVRCGGGGPPSFSSVCHVGIFFSTRAIGHSFPFFDSSPSCQQPPLLCCSPIQEYLFASLSFALLKLLHSKYCWMFVENIVWWDGSLMVSLVLMESYCLLLLLLHYHLLLQ